MWKLGTFKDIRNVPALTNTDTIEEETSKEDNNTATIEQDSTDAIYKDARLGNKKISLEVTENPVKLISVQTKKKKQMLCCELSPTGEYIFYSTNSDLRLLKLDIVSINCNTMS